MTSDGRPPTGNGPPSVPSAGRRCCGRRRGDGAGRKPGRVLERLGNSRAGGTTTTGTTGGSGGPPQWSALAGMLSGTLVVPGDATYANDALLFNELITSPQPAAIAYCATAADVQRCVAYARAHDVPLAARSGGHSYAGYSSSPGLVDRRLVPQHGLGRVGDADGHRRSGRPAHRRLQPIGVLGPPPSRWVVPDRRHRRPGARAEGSACSGGPTA